MRNFRSLLIWQNAVKITADVCFFATSLPTEEKFGMRSQITRAAVSMPSNIAEGCSRKSDKELACFLEIALGSAFELETQLIICQTINIGDSSIANEIFPLLTDFQKMLNAYYTKITHNSQLTTNS